MSTKDNIDLKVPSSILVILLESLHSILKYVSDVVRKALQAKKVGTGGGGGEVGSREAETAENLLLTNRPFTELMSMLTQLVSQMDSC